MRGIVLSILVSFAAGPVATSVLAQKKPDPALELYFAANAAYNRKLYPIAAGNYQKFLATYASHEKAQLARYGLGLSQFALKQYDRAVNEFRTLLEAKQLEAKIERGRLTLLHAQCLLYSGKQDEAQARLIAAASNLKAGVQWEAIRVQTATSAYYKNNPATLTRHGSGRTKRQARPPGPLCTNLHNFLFIFIHFYARITVWCIAFAGERLCAKYACI